MKRTIFAIAISSVVCLTGYAQGRILPVLESHTDVRSAAMGRSSMGTSQGQYLYNNPAAFLFSTHKANIDVSTEVFPKANEGRLMQYNLAGAYKLGDNSAIFAGVRYQGGIKVTTTQNGNAGETISPRDYTIDLGYAFKVVPSIVAYATGSYINTYVGTKAHAWAVSFGASYQKEVQLMDLPSTITVGARLLDLGKSIKYNDTGLPYSLPTSIVLGGDWRVQVADKHEVTYALSGRFFTPKEGRETYIGTGAEYTYSKLVSARVGYQYADKGANCFTAGVGAQYANFNLDVTYSHATSIEGVNTLLVGVGYHF